VRDLTHGWYDDNRQVEGSAHHRPELFLIGDDHQPQHVTQAELETRGLGHIVIASMPEAIVQQRKSSTEESISRESREEPARVFVPNSSIFLG
jgi:hypothetical protein